MGHSEEHAEVNLLVRDGEAVVFIVTGGDGTVVRGIDDGSCITTGLGASTSSTRWRVTTSSLEL